MANTLKLALSWNHDSLFFSTFKQKVSVFHPLPNVCWGWGGDQPLHECSLSNETGNDVIYHLIQWKKVVTKNNVSYDFIREDKDCPGDDLIN